MAQHGSSPPELQRPPPAPAPPGPVGLAQVHRPRVLRPAAPTPTTPAPAPGDVVTLASPRPDTERVTNEYVETPFRPAPPPPPAAKTPAAAPKPQAQRPPPPPLALALGRATGPDSGRDLQALHLPVLVAPGKKQEAVRAAAPGAVSSAAGAASLSAAGSSPALAAADCFRGSIICPDCGRCRCESCRKPRPLPSRWLCDNSCYCSAETALDYATCLCCVKGLFYHCCRDHDHDLEGADEPCACGPPRCAARWGCLCALSALLPCLWCYWPLRALLRVCEACYRRHSAAGCRCRAPAPAAPGASALLLDASPDF